MKEEVEEEERDNTYIINIFINKNCCNFQFNIYSIIIIQCTIL